MNKASLHQIVPFTDTIGGNFYIALSGINSLRSDFKVS